LRQVADDISAAGGTAHVAVVDALVEHDVEVHTAEIVARSGSLDVSVNVINDQDVQGTPFVEMSVEDYVRPVRVAVTSKFLTARAAARQMIQQRSGVILIFGGAFDWNAAKDLRVGGMGTTFEAVEAMRRQLSAELGPHGIRAVTLRTAGLPDTIPTGFEGSDEVRRWLVDQTVTGRAATLDDVGNVAAFAASDVAASVIGSINMTAGSVLS
jgi:NAD(P)-dependent dehydrogenase (short-subunit alcohol dehydrogenase family)